MGLKLERKPDNETIVGRVGLETQIFMLQKKGHTGQMLAEQLIDELNNTKQRVKEVVK